MRVYSDPEILCTKETAGFRPAGSMYRTADGATVWEGAFPSHTI